MIVNSLLNTGTIGKRFELINLENTEENRRRYRQMLFTTEGIEKFISGVILYKETLRQVRRMWMISENKFK